MVIVKHGNGGQTYVKENLFHTDRNEILSGQFFFETRDESELIKEPENQYDSEAIRVEMKGLMHKRV